MKKIVIKIGSSVLFSKNNNLDRNVLEKIAQQVLALQAKGYGIILVISGAVAMGAKFVEFKKNEFVKKQAAAGIGQVYLISKVKDIFLKKNLLISQLLLTKKSLMTVNEKKDLKKIIEFYCNSGFIPVINENDISDLNSFGGNDILGAEISGIINATQFVILSTMEGARFGVGGGKTKQLAKEFLENLRIKTKVENGRTKNIILNSVL